MIHGNFTSGTLQTAECKKKKNFLYDEFAKCGNEWGSEIPGTRVAHGPLLRIELGSIDCKRFVHKRIRWCTNSDISAKDLTVWSSQKRCRICENERTPVETKLILEAVKGDLLEDGTISELDLKLAGPIPPEHIFSFAQVQDNCEELDQQHYDDTPGTFPSPELIRAGRAGEFRWCE